MHYEHVSRGNQAINEISLQYDDCGYNYATSYPSIFFFPRNKTSRCTKPVGKSNLVCLQVQFGKFLKRTWTYFPSRCPTLLPPLNYWKEMAELALCFSLLLVQVII
ncbi:hypothetical protein SUGI_0496030 [Cryptomeria japonica]|nr:hypothetical protein SUGI_0496030 [Cryptomeria japonica]